MTIETTAAIRSRHFAALALALGIASAAGGQWLVNGVEVPELRSHTTELAGGGEYSVARLWNEELLEAIRHDLARPTIHARNLFHVSIAMWDAWAVYSANAYPFLSPEHYTVANQQAAREEAISYAAYHVLLARFADSPGAALTIPSIRGLMLKLGYNPDFHGTVGSSARAVGNRIAINVLNFGLNDNANEQTGYANQYYVPINEPLLPEFPGNPEITDNNRWQPLALQFFIDQGGNPVPTGYPPALSPEWGQVSAFALSPADLTIYYRDPPAPDEDFAYWVYHDPGPPPLIGGVGDFYYKWGFEMVSVWQSHLDSSDGVLWDISPASYGNSPTPDPADFEDYYVFYGGGDVGTGFPLNPVTNQPYTPQIVPRGDFARCLAEFWADGPQSETPPGHWFSVLNYVSDHPQHVKRIGGQGPIVPDLEWDVKAYIAMAGAQHDTAVSVWGIKGWYDYIRPISAIRYMADQGQCTDPKDVATFDVNGLNLRPGLIEVITPETAGPGGYHEHLAFSGDPPVSSIGKIALYTWRGHEFFYSEPPGDPETEAAGVGWILAENFMPYQRPSFVTPPFPGYTSGHSAYSRAGAELLTLLTASEYFPAGLGEFFCPQNEFLVFEEGPSVDITLQWAKYDDGSSQSSLSRIWGGIHPPADDLPSRIIGAQTGPDAWAYALTLFEGSGYIPCPYDVDLNSTVDVSDLLAVLAAWGTNPGGPPDFDGNGNVGVEDLLAVLGAWGNCAS